MNEKFNKAEIWRQIGKGKALVESDDRGESSNVNDIRERDEKSLNIEIQPTYSKDDFFDKFSSAFEPDTHRRRALVSEQLKVDMEIPGDFPRHLSNMGGGRGFHGGNRSRWLSNRGGGRGFRGGNGGRWRRVHNNGGSGYNTRGDGHGAQR